MEASQLLDQLQKISSRLGLTRDELLYKLTHPSSISPYSSLAALTLLASSLLGVKPISTDRNISATGHKSQTEASENVAGPSRSVQRHPAVDFGEDFQPSSTLLEDSMPVLSAALSGDAIDAGIAWTFYLIDKGVDLEHDTASMLLELLVPLASGSPDPLARTAIIKLISCIISTVKEPKDQVLLYLQLLEPENPFDMMRVQAISMLREAVSQPSSPLLTSHLQLLTSTLFALPTTTVSPTLSSFTSSTIPTTQLDASDPSPPLKLPLESLIPSMWPAWFTENLQLLRVMLSIDKDNLTGYRDESALRNIYSDWVLPQRQKVNVLLRGFAEEQGLDPAVEFVLFRWDDALSRLGEEISSILGDLSQIQPDGGDVAGAADSTKLGAIAE